LQLPTTLARRAKTQFIEQTKQPLAVQEQYLKKLLSLQQNTQLGRHYQGFSARSRCQSGVAESEAYTLPLS